ncbi:MAG: lysine 2,3-aminomutase [bacterium]|nr:lysine 2,3-aminomutase [bacterium]
MPFEERQKKIAAAIDPQAGLADWEDWKWQMKHAVKDIHTFETLTGITFSPERRAELEKTLRKFPLSITPYYLSLIDTTDPGYENDPIFKQSFPDVRELIVDKFEMEDPLCEDKGPVGGWLTHRYPDRVLFIVSRVCSMYCRHCTRKRKVGDTDIIPPKSIIMEGIEYIKNTPRVRDVLISGGDPLMMSDDYLDWILTELWKIPHVEIVRIGTRMPITLPYRITGKLTTMLRKHHPLWVNVHFNHPREMTPDSMESLRKLADAGIPLGNQTTLLAGVNDSPAIIKKLNHLLVRNRVRPYYLFQCDLSEGLTHFRTTISKGIEIMEHLIGHTTGFSVPKFAVDVPGGGGKIPLLPNYLVSWSDRKVLLRNYEGVIAGFKEPDNYRSMPLETGGENGVAKILSGAEENTSLTPCETAPNKKN